MPVTAATCAVCGTTTEFAVAAGLSRREARCGACGATWRNHDMARALLMVLAPDCGDLRTALPRLQGTRIFEAQAAGALHDALQMLPGYTCAEYLPGVARGDTRDGVRCEDVTALTFPDGAFDLVITQDVLEHVPEPERALRECARVLTAAGSHLCTVPLHEGRATVARARRQEDVLVDVLPPVWHADPLRDAGSRVCTDFGDDFPALAARCGLRAAVAVRTAWYAPAQITAISDGENYAAYRAATAAGTLEALLRYFRYNSVVWRLTRADVTY